MAELQALVQKRYVKPLQELAALLKSGSINRKVCSVFLYGSVAKREAKEESDVDVMLVLDHRKLSKSEEKELESIKTRIYERHGLKIHFECITLPVVTVKGARRWKEHEWIAREVFADGVLLYGNSPLAIPPEFFGLSEYDLFSYNLNAIPKSKAVSLSRKLNGFTQKKIVNGKMREYETKGIIERIGGRKIGKGVMLIPKESFPHIIMLFEGYNIIPSVTTVFLIENK